ncbi:MAG: DUF4397 domain-containing protein [Pseudomonadota bacterium]|nr:DUF4397 domain-containing protein [Pseudomonadota bacterium]
MLASVLIAACGGSSSSSDTTQLRLINATQTHASLTLLSNASAAISGIPTDSSSAYAGVPSGSPALQLNDATTSTVLATTAPSLAKDSHYALLAYESGGVVRTSLISEDTTAPAAGIAALRVFDTATDSGAIDVYVTDPSVDITTLSSPTFTFASSTQTQSGSYLTFAPGTFRIRVTGQGNTSDLRLDIPAVTLTSQQLATVILTPTIGGTLINGGVLTQQGTFTATRNTNARVRLVADVGGGASVSATAGSTTISSSVVSPAVGAYTLVPASSVLAVKVNGATLAAPATQPAAGSDTTLVVYGNSAASAVASLISDDNHLPTVTTALKIRLFNGLSGSTTPLTLTADFAQVAVNVQPGKASPYSTITPSASLRLEVMGNSGTVYMQSLTPPTNAVYTLFLLGDASAPVPLLRRDH